MNTSPFKNSSSPMLNRDSGLEEHLKDMSPVTDLAFNLQSLKTAAGTPNRRISWSSPYPSVYHPAKCAGDFSPIVDSPMLQEILARKAGKQQKSHASRKAMLKGDDKENICPRMSLGSITSQDDDDAVENDSQDSGYASTSGKSSQQFCSIGQTPRFRVRSTLFTSTNTNLEELDSLFLMEDDDSNLQPPVELNMTSLLTKPLCTVDNDEGAVIRKNKPPTRRCLTMEMECSSDSSQMDFLSQTEMTFANTTSFVSDTGGFQKLPFKRPDPCEMVAWHSKRRKSSPSVHFSEDTLDITGYVKKRSSSETAATIMQAVQKADLQPDLIGDCTRYYALPLVKGRHQDLKCISPQTLVQLMCGEYQEKIDSFTLVDCRYPYEFEGGHIRGAKNIYTKEEILQTFLENTPEPSERSIIIFHCEFSSERAPNLCRFLRNKDREMNECNYPKLHHPEIYLLEGGYKAFFASFREFCEPQDYKPMNHKDHSSDLRLFRAKSKSWGSDSKIRLKMKSTPEITHL